MYKINGFDNEKKLCVGNISIPIQLGPKNMEIKIYFLDKKLPYNILLRRQWIHSMRCVSSNFHTLSKFNHDGKEYVIKATDDPKSMLG